MERVISPCLDAAVTPGPPQRVRGPGLARREPKGRFQATCCRQKQAMRLALVVCLDSSRVCRHCVGDLGGMEWAAIV